VGLERAEKIHHRKLPCGVLSGHERGEVRGARVSSVLPLYVPMQRRTSNALSTVRSLNVRETREKRN
jgi:hypothetical protein